MKRSLAALAALTAVSFCSTAAMAENRAGAFTVTPVIGGYTFDGVQKIDPNFLAGIKAGYNLTDRFTVEGLFHYVHSKSDSLATIPKKSTDVITYRMELLYHMFPKNTFVPFLAAGYGGISTHPKDSGKNFADSGAFSYGFGAKYFLTDNVALRADLRNLIIDPGFTEYNPSLERRTTVYNYEYTLGLNFQFGGNKPAPQPVVAAVVPKAAPVQAPKPVEPPPAPKKVEPQPPAPAPSPAPLAPVVALSASPANVDKGSPSTLSWNTQNTTECSLLPGVGTVQTNGSKQSTGKLNVTPAETTTYKLACKGPGGAAESLASVHVNPPLDRDKDGVLDENDKCPNTPVGTKVDKSGCPLPVCNSNITLYITFDTAKADIKEKNYNDLKEVADKMTLFPKSTVVIEGHTDNVGSAASNLKLSQRRADAVRQYMIDKRGIAAGRITAVGYGLTKPVKSNKTEDGRRSNRRVQAVFTCPE